MCLLENIPSQYHSTFQYSRSMEYFIFFEVWTNSIILHYALNFCRNVFGKLFSLLKTGTPEDFQIWNKTTINTDLYSTIHHLCCLTSLLLFCCFIMCKKDFMLCILLYYMLNRCCFFISIITMVRTILTNTVFASKMSLNKYMYRVFVQNIAM